MITLDTPYNGHFTNLNYRVYSLWLAREIPSNHFLIWQTTQDRFLSQLHTRRNEEFCLLWVLSSRRLLDGLDLLSSTPGITVVGGFPFTASPESPCASEARSLFSAGNGRTSTAPSRQ